MTFSSLLIAYLCLNAQVEAWIVTSYYKTSVTTIPNPFFPGGTESEASVVTIPVFPTAAVSTLSAYTVTDNAPDLVPYLTVVEVLIPTDAPATTTTSALFACDSNGVNTCPTGLSYNPNPIATAFIAYLTMTAPSFCSSSFSYVQTMHLSQGFQIPDEVTSAVLASATYISTYVEEEYDSYEDSIVNVTHVDVYVPTNLYTATTGDGDATLASQCIDPRNTADGGAGTTTCTPGPDGPTQGCPIPTLSAVPSTTTPPLIDTSGILSAISSAESSAIAGGKKNDARRVSGDNSWIILISGFVCVQFLVAAVLL